MKRFRIIMAVCLTLLIAAVAIPFATSFFEAGSIAQLITGAAVALATVPVFGNLETSLQVKEKRGDIYKQMTALNDLAKNEKRDFTDEEQRSYDSLADQFDKLGDRLKKIEADERRAAEMAGAFHSDANKKQEKKEIRKYNFFRAIKAKAEGRSLDGLELEMHQEAEKEARTSGISISGLGIPNIILADHAERRAMTATGTTSTAGDQGGMLIPTDKDGLIMALRPKLVLSQMGAKMFGGMVGNLDLVKGTSTSVAWETENGDSNETSPATSKISVSPQRLAAHSPISKQLLLQTNIGLQDDVLNDLLAAVAQAVEAAAINGAGHGSNQPLGILGTSGIGSVAGGTDGAAPVWSHITQLEAAVEIANADQNMLAYLTNNKVKNQLKNTKLDTGSGLFIWGQNSNELNGYKAFTSNLVPHTLTKGSSTGVGVCSAIVFGDFTNLHIYNWGGMDITVDPYTLAGNAQIKLVVNTWWDTAVKHPGAFAAMLDVLTTL